MLLSILHVIALAAVTHSANNSTGAGFSFADWHVSTSKADFNWQSGHFSAPNHILLTRPGSSIEADQAQGNEKTNQATLLGHVVLHDRTGVLTGFASSTLKDAPATLTCAKLEIDGVTKRYTAIGHVVFLQGSYRVEADRAVMEGVTHMLHLYGHVKLVS